MTVFLLVGTFMVAVTAIVTGSAPQANVMMPPLVTAACSALKVQLAAVPVPTTVVGVAVFTGWPRAGTPALQEPLGLPAPLEPTPVVPPAPPVALLPPAPPLPRAPPLAAPPEPLAPAV